MNSCAPASLAAAMTRSIGMAGSARAIFSRTELLNSTFSCRTTPIWRRSHAAGAAEQQVVAAFTEERVVAGAAEQLIRARTAGQRVVAGAAEQLGGGKRAF